MKLSKNDWIHSIVLGFLGTYLCYVLLYFGYVNGNGIEVLIIQYCWPIFVIILSVLILKEKINGRKIVAIILGFLGVFVILTKGELNNLYFENIFVDSIVLLAAFTAGLFSVLSKKVKIDPLPIVTIYYLSAIVFSFFSMILFSDFKLPTNETYLPILINGIFVNGISYLFWVVSMILLILFFKEVFHF